MFAAQRGEAPAHPGGVARRRPTHGTDPSAVSVPQTGPTPQKVDPMSNLTKRRPLKRALIASMTLPASAGAFTAVGVAPAGPASAARCPTARHAYLTQPGRAYFSGYEGNQQFGVPTVTYAQGTQAFRLGGNGISPGSGVDFFAFDRNTGAQVGFIPGRPAQYYTTRAGSNCVVNENGPFYFTLPPGNYRIVANYFPGNNFRLVTDVVANVDVLPPPPPPPPVS